MVFRDAQEARRRLHIASAVGDEIARVACIGVLEGRNSAGFVENVDLHGKYLVGRYDSNENKIKIAIFNDLSSGKEATRAIQEGCGCCMNPFYVPKEGERVSYHPFK